MTSYSEGRPYHSPGTIPDGHGPRRKTHKTPDETKEETEGANVKSIGGIRGKKGVRRPEKRTGSVIPCHIKQLSPHLQEAALEKSLKRNRRNLPTNVEALRVLGKAHGLPRSEIAAIASKEWERDSTLMVYFMDKPAPPQELQEKILCHMNAWNEVCSIRFVLTRSPRAEVRITLEDDGYWSYLGTDILQVPLNEPTMCLQDFSLDTDDSEFYRVVRHETGHTLSFPHEHMRQEIVENIDEQKAIAYFARPPNNWDEPTTRANVLTPLDYSALDATMEPDEFSIMCYSLPGEIMIDGDPVMGGLDIDTMDRDFAASIYPN